MKMNQTQLDRMKAMMTYGLQTESKKNDFSGLEYQREAADGKMYGIVREGTKYYIKVSEKKNNVLKEDFNYIGGFRNRKDYEYNSYANALKHFDMKMASINESFGNREPLVESWNPDKKEMLTVEATERMKREIARQRQIMGNAKMIQEKKAYDCVEKDCANTQKPNIKTVKAECGDATNVNGDPFTKKPAKELGKVQSPNIKKEGCARVNEGEQVLGWNDNEEYLDTTNGTEIGDSAPFDCNGESCEMDNGVVEEGVAMHNTDNQNSPSVGVGEVGDDDPFTEKAKNELQEGEEMLMDDEEGDEFDGEVDDIEFEDDETNDEFDSDNEFDSNGESEETSDFEADSETVTKEDFDALKSLVQAIADELGVSSFEDDDLYDEGSQEDEYEVSFDDEEDSLDGTDEEPMEAEDELQEESVVYESRAYRKMMKEDKLNYFGKHPAYRKKPMELPTAKHQEMLDYYDMNDESVYGERPFGEKIGSGAPFEIKPEDIENAIAESIKRVMKKKI